MDASANYTTRSSALPSDAEQFLTALVGGPEALPLLVQNRLVIPLCCNAAIPPSTEGRWGSTASWQGGPVPAAATHYSPVLVHGDGGGGGCERNGASIVAVLAAVADDTPPEGLLGIPTWARIETRAGQFQEVFRFPEIILRGEAVTGKELADALASVAAAKSGEGLDASGNNFLRWARLPGLDAIPGHKAGKPPKVPARLAAIGGPTITPLDLLLSLWPHMRPQDRNRIDVPDGEVLGLSQIMAEDTLFRWMREKGWATGQPSGSAWWCKCPWAHEHTPDEYGEIDPEMHYIAEHGTFKCHRGKPPGSDMGHLHHKARALGWGSETRLIKAHFEGLGAPVHVPSRPVSAIEGLPVGFTIKCLKL